MIVDADIVVVGAGAAGLMATIQAGRLARAANSSLRIVAMDGATSLGAKILIAGGGRCNVTHFEVDETAFAGASRHAIRKVLRRFDVPETIALFRELGVTLKREYTGKLFPTTDKARTVLNALLHECQRMQIDIHNSMRVQSIDRDNDAFVIRAAPKKGTEVSFRARRVVLATGGMALPKSGSDGFGYELVRRLGHTVTTRIFPALVPLKVPDGHWIRALKGVSLHARLELHSASGKRLQAFTNSILLTHFGVSGPAVLDISRYWTDAYADDPGSKIVVNWLPGETLQSIDEWLLAQDTSSIGRRLSQRLPERLAKTICESVGVDSATVSHQLPRQQRRALAGALVETQLPVVGDRGFTHAEVTAGGVPLSELDLKTMQSRFCPGLHICGEICDVDGRIGGFNFQWAWSSGYIAGVSAANAVI